MVRLGRIPAGVGVLEQYFGRHVLVHGGRPPSCWRPLVCDLSALFGPCGSLQHPGRRVCRLLLSSLRLFSSSAAGLGDAPALPAGPAHFMVDYLVSSCGLSRLEALGASRPLTHLKSPEKPDAVVRLLRQADLGDDHIRSAVRRYPRMLLFKPEKTLEPKIRALKGAGFSGSEVAQLISTKPTIIHAGYLQHRLEFWRKVVGTKQDVLKVVKRAPVLLFYGLNGRVIPRISLLRDLGVPDDKMGKLIQRKPRWVYIKSDRIQTLVEQVKGLGFTPGSPMFVHALHSVGNLSRSTMDAKFKLLGSYGWTQAELMFAIRLFPSILACSEKKIHVVMCFLLNEAGCEPSYVARRPGLLGYSIEKRLMPRNYVLQYLKNRCISSSIKDLWTAMHISDHYFIRKFIVPYRDQLPELFEAYHTVLSSQAKRQHW